MPYDTMVRFLCPTACSRDSAVTQILLASNAMHSESLVACSLVFSGQPRSSNIPRRACSLSSSCTAERRGSALCCANAPQVALAQEERKPRREKENARERPTARPRAMLLVMETFIFLVNVYAFIVSA
jgi:hypothetical protein